MTLFKTESKLLKMKDELSNSDEASDGNESDNDSNSNDSTKESGGDNSDSTKVINAGWVDSVAKILRTKKPKNKKTLVLSKAKKISDVKIVEKKPDVGFQIDGEVKDEKVDPGILDKLKEEDDEPAKKKRKEIPNIRIKPDILDKDRERTLSKIATRGVVQLFNAVRMQQKDIDKQLQDAGPLDRKRENVLKNIDKRAFLDVLMDKKSQPVDGGVKIETKVENKTKNESTWNVLRDDFMMGAKLKDWDKETEEDDVEAEELSDSD